jgi:hypothetical protein
MKAKEKVKGYKGFDKNLRCRGFQYEIGKEYEHKGAVEACNSGFHLCEHPLDVFTYYTPPESRFCEVEGSGKMSRSNSDIDIGANVAASKIKIGEELSLRGIVEAAVKFVFERTNKEEKSCGERGDASATGSYGAASATGKYGAALATGIKGAAYATGGKGAASATGGDGAASATGVYGAALATGGEGAASATGVYGAALATGRLGAASATGSDGAALATGYKGAASATGYYGAAVADGYCGAAVANGYCGAASATGDQAIALGSGIESRAKASLGSWIVLSEWNFDAAINKYNRVNVSAKKVDGEVIKAGTYYTLKNGEFVEV